MKIIAISGSPRRGGNSETLLREAVRGTGHDVKVYEVCRMDIGPCRECGECETTGVCVYLDDMQALGDALRGADRIVLASPVFFAGIPAQLKAMVDRCQQFWCEKFLLGRPMTAGRYGRKGLFLVVGGMKMQAGVECAGVTAKAFFRTLSVPGHETLAYREVDAMGAIQKHPTALKDAFEAGKRLAAWDE